SGRAREASAEVGGLPAARRVGVEPADALEQVAAKREVGGDGERKRFAREVAIGREMADARGVALGRRRRRKAKELTRHAARTFSEGPRDLLQPTAAGHAVGIGEGDDLTARRRDTAVAGGGGSTPRLAQHADRMAFEDLAGGVGRSVVD